MKTIATSELTFLFLLLGTLTLSIILTLVLEKRKALIASILLPWLAFLGLNLLSEYYSPDRELVKGSFIFFQATLGTIMALVGAAGWYSVQKIRVNNNQGQTTIFRRKGRSDLIRGEHVD